MLLPLPRRSHWRCRLAHPSSGISLPRKGSRVGLRIDLFEACSAFTRVTACTLALSPICDSLSEGFSHFVTSMTAPVASGWSICRAGFTPTGKRRLITAHTQRGLSKTVDRREKRRAGHSGVAAPGGGLSPGPRQLESGGRDRLLRGRLRLPLGSRVKGSLFARGADQSFPEPLRQCRPCNVCGGAGLRHELCAPERRPRDQRDPWGRRSRRCGRRGCAASDQGHPATAGGRRPDARR